MILDLHNDMYNKTFLKIMDYYIYILDLINEYIYYFYYLGEESIK